jgi:excisionase family DNA binding protein
MKPDKLQSISDIKKKYIGVVDLAEMLNISKSTIYTWVCYRKIPFTKVGSRLVFSVSRIERWLKDNSHEPSDWWKKSR